MSGGALQRSALMTPVVILLALLIPIPAEVQTGASGAESVKPLIAMLTVRGEGDVVSNGAAIIVGRRANRLYLVTALHVVTPHGRLARDVTVRLAFLPGETFGARVLEHRDRALDLAVLQISGIREFADELDRLPFARLAAPVSLKPGDHLYAIGNPEGQEWFSNVSPDRFRGLRNELLEIESQTIRFGHSGGGLFTERWLLTGMITHADPPVSRAVPIDRILNRLRDWNYPVDLKREFGTGREQRATEPSTPSRGPQRDAAPPARTANVILAYAGDQYACRLLLEVSIGGRTIVPLANFFPASGIPLGDQPYSISGRIDCPLVGSCLARGSGRVEVEEGATFNIIWVNSAIGTCDVQLFEP